MYVRTTMEVPGVGSAIHIAEMEEVDVNTCTMLRMIALAPNDAVAGAATPSKAVETQTFPSARYHIPTPTTTSPTSRQSTFPLTTSRRCGAKQWLFTENFRIRS